jgi:hypothetical protein
MFVELPVADAVGTRDIFDLTGHPVSAPQESDKDK